MSDDLTDIKELLRLGFRLPDDHQHHSQTMASQNKASLNKSSQNAGAQKFVAKAMAAQNERGQK